MKSIDFAFIEADGSPSSYLISLNKLFGDKKVVDVVGYVSTEFGDNTFKISYIVLDDGTKLHCGGEHDMPYIEDDVPNIDDIEDD